MSAHADCIRALSRSLGAERLLTSREDVAPYETGARYGAGCAAFVVRPETTAEVSAAVRLCVQHGIPLVVQGANTGLVGAASPDGSGQHAVLAMDRMTKILEVDTANRSALVSAGLRLSALNARLAENGLIFPIDLGADPSIGGMVATNTGGARFLRYGDVRRSVLGLEVVLADEAGTIVNLGGGIRKNNAGMDIKQLFIGTGGAFGIVTKAELEVQPMPRHSATALVVPASRAEVGALLLAAETAFGELLSSFEGMSRNAMDCVLSNIPNARNPFHPESVPEYAVLIEIASSGDHIDGQAWLADRMQRFLEEALTHGAIVNAVTDHPEKLWAIRHSISEALRHEGRILGLDIAMRRGDLARFHAEAAALLRQDFPWLKICDFGHGGDGGDHFNLIWPSRDAPAYDEAVALKARGALYDLVVRRYGGSFSAEHGLGPHNQKYYDAYTAPDIKRISREIAALFSPNKLLGRVLLG